MQFIKLLVLICTCWPFFVAGQDHITLLFLDQNKPVPRVLVHSGDKMRSAVSDQEGKLTWKFSDLPDTLQISHLGFLDQTFILHPRSFELSPLEINLQQKIVELQVAQIEAHWVRPNSVIVQSTMQEEAIENKFLVQDIPYLIHHFPSTVSTSDAGNGIGYTNVRIRGLDPTQINVMINGIPLNDAESQSVFWVDLPDLVASASGVQVQRGIGLSGAGQVAFGSSLLINTNKLSTDPYVQLESSAGSFNTFKNSLQFNSGMLNQKWNFGGRLSHITSDGFIDRAKSDLWSGTLSMSYITAKRSARLFIFDGLEKTYQAWYGMPVQYLNDPIRRTFNPAGTEKAGDPYENQVDHYRQTHFQFLHKEVMGTSWEWQNTLHFTPGKGYYEEYKSGQNPADYSLAGNPEINLVRKRNLDNDFFGSIHSIKYSGPKIEWNTGLAWNGYRGRHFGQVVQINDLPVPPDSKYYDHRASKWTSMAFGTLNWKFKGWTLTGDVQYRWLVYKYLPELGTEPSSRSAHHHFFNPKIGFSFDLKPGIQWFGFSGLAHREPNRNDYVQADHALPKAERLWDNELGARWLFRPLQIEQNFYFMQYKDQLIPTGKLNDVGAYIRSNVDRSFRLGSETSVAWQSKSWAIESNLNLSRNQTAVYKEYVDNWDTGLQEINIYQNQPIAFSPGLIANLNISYRLFDRERAKSKQALFLEFAEQAVGRQYLDGTGQPGSLLPAYQLTQLALRYGMKVSGKMGVDFRFQVNNVFDAQYESNGWIYRFQSNGYNPVPDDPFAATEGSGIYHLKGLYPQAGRNLMLSCRIKLGQGQE